MESHNTFQLPSISKRSMSKPLCRTPSPQNKMPRSPLLTHEKSKFAPNTPGELKYTYGSKHNELSVLVDHKLHNSISKRSLTPRVSSRRDEVEKEVQFTIDDFDMLNIIGVGCYGTVRLAKMKKSGTPVAIKIISKEYALKMGQEKNLYSEKYFLSTLKHPYIPKLYYRKQLCRPSRYSTYILHH
jgi:Protein kinase domain